MEKKQEVKAKVQPTLRSLAEASGLGLSTISRALRNDPQISAETRHKVKALAAELGYRPNRAGVRLRTGKTNVIALVLNPQDDGSGFFSNLVYGISDILAATAYHLVITPYDQTDPLQALRYITETATADGVIFSRIEPADARVKYLHDLGFPFATYGRTDMGIEHCYADYDSEAYARTAIARLKAQGRQNIALIPPPGNLTYSRHMRAGFNRGLEELNVNGRIMEGVDGDSSMQDLRKAAAATVHSKTAPDGIICCSASAAASVIIGLEDNGLRFSKDFDLVAKPMTEEIALLYPAIISLPEDFRQAGRNLAQILLKQIAGADPSTLQILERP